MEELSLHILDIAQNSVTAGAGKIEIEVAIDTKKDTLSIVITDDGCGMSEDFLAKVRDPFTTTRTTRKAGLGIPLFESAAVQTGGSFDIKSELGAGTQVRAEFGYSSIDRAPLGNMAETIEMLILGSPDVRFIYKHIKDENEFVFDTDDIRKQLGEVSLAEPSVLDWIFEYISEGISL